MRFDTRLVRIGQDPEPGTGDVVPPLHLAVTYERDMQDPPRYFYGRGENPTREDLERALAAVEDAPFATVYASGQAAAMTAVSVLRPGQRLLSSDDVYGGTHTLFAMLTRYDIRVDYADLSDPAVVEQVLGDDGDDVAMVWVESPSNPLLKVVDLADVCRRAHRRGALVVVDNTLAGPVLQQPLALGADVSLYSTTKSVAGHLDVLGGALVYHDPALHDSFLAYRTTAGNMAGPLDCFLVHRGLKTMSLRVARQVDNAEAVVAALRAEPTVGRIHYPGLPGHPGHEVARRQMTRPGSLVSFEYLHDPEKLMSRVGLFASAVSLGGVRSLIECPALMTHRPVPREVRLRLGVTDNLIRLSLGIEDPADLVTDLVTALRAGRP
ncbi:trans-sulfuration enzyme family protein [Micromonospora echinofusca]|uniref:PLP-dependent transferase n=1 Tax=Micromonospora echinofusca TaxID=47858 RepID=A0ABS3VKK5_MICEH|nr:PLP-dependent aspartate aminotransferase family protein [Micromonospora echinofusca]MBO4205001.1 PLP-dependent transferase [Micromonospora echinofusca]